MWWYGFEKIKDKNEAFFFIGFYGGGAYFIMCFVSVSVFLDVVMCEVSEFMCWWKFMCISVVKFVMKLWKW